MDFHFALPQSFHNQAFNGKMDTSFWQKIIGWFLETVEVPENQRVCTTCLKYEIEQSTEWLEVMVDYAYRGTWLQ